MYVKNVVLKDVDNVLLNYLNSTSSERFSSNYAERFSKLASLFLLQYILLIKSEKLTTVL